MMNGYKSIFTTVTFWGTAISFFALMFPNVWVKFGITDQSALAAHIVGAIGAIVAIYGRFRATKLVTLTGAPPAPPPKAQ
jgi:uncharacterized membrane protein YwaF